MRWRDRLVDDRAPLDSVHCERGRRGTANRGEGKAGEQTTQRPFRINDWDRPLDLPKKQAETKISDRSKTVCLNGVSFSAGFLVLARSILAFDVRWGIGAEGRVAASDRSVEPSASKKQGRPLSIPAESMNSMFNRQALEDPKQRLAAFGFGCPSPRLFTLLESPKRGCETVGTHHDIIRIRYCRRRYVLSRGD